MCLDGRSGQRYSHMLMSMPDISRLTSASLDSLQAFGRRLRAIGVSIAAAAPVVDAAIQVAPALRQPIRAFHLRQMRAPVGFAMRMFLFGDPVTAEEARIALGDLVSPLLDVGLLNRRDDGTLVSPFVLGVADDLFVLSDDLSHGQDAVMGFGKTTIELCRASFPVEPVGSVLDLGCGSGTAALLLSRRATRVVATDINPRAIALARVNARINGLTNIEFRGGDLFAPVRGESFDLIVSQPPFVPRPDGVREASFLYGGTRGDELALALLGGIPAHLAPGGRAVLFVEWPDDGTEALETRLRKALRSDDVNLLVLRMPPSNLDSHAASYAAGLHPALGPEFEASALLRREHFERQGIRRLDPTLTIIERGASPGFTELVPVMRLSNIAPTSDRIDKMMSARKLAGSPTDLLASTLRVPEGTVIVQEQVGPGAEVPSTLAARFPPNVMVPQIEMTLDMLQFVTAIHESETLESGIARFAEETSITTAEAIAASLPIATQALLYGLFEVAGR